MARLTQPYEISSISCPLFTFCALIFCCVCLKLSDVKWLTASRPGGRKEHYCVAPLQCSLSLSRASMPRIFSPIPDLTGILCHPAFLLSLSLYFVLSSSTSSNLSDVESSLGIAARSPDVISELTVLCLLTHTQRDLGSLAQPPGNQPAGHKEERTMASIWWGLFPWDAAVAVGKAEHNIPNLRIRIRMLLLVKELCLESASSGKPPHIGIAGRIPTKCLLLLFAGWGIVLALKASNWYSSFFLLSSMCFQTQVWNSVDGNYTSTLIFKPQTQLAH